MSIKQGDIRKIYQLKRNCIYCFEPIKKKTRWHIIQESIGGSLLYPLGCENCNHKLGGNIEDKISKDYWVNFAKVKLGLRDFKIDPTFKFDNRQNRYTVDVMPTGKQRGVPPITDNTTFRIVAKIAYDSAAFFIAEGIFLPTFDEYRGFILTGEPDLSEKSIIRCCYDLPWAPGHVIEFQPHKEFFSIAVRLFNAYTFTAFFRQPVGGPYIFPMRVIMDLDTKQTLFQKLSSESKTWQYIGGY